MYVLTAPPKMGKSTAIKKIINMLGAKNCCGFYTKEIIEDGKRVGFKIVTLSGKEGILADVSYDGEHIIGKYGVNLKEFEKVALTELESIINADSNKYVIIDEIGPMQLFSDKYKELLLKIASTDKKIIGTAFYESYDWLDDFKKLDNVELIEINEMNRNDIPMEVVEKISKDDSLFQTKIQKAKKYVLDQNRFVDEGNKIIINSDHGTRVVNKLKDGGYSCSCDYFKSKGTCSHIMACIIR